MDFKDEKKQQEACQEAEKIINRQLTDEELALVSGGDGDARRDVNEAMADAAALEQDIDGFDF